MKISDQTKGYLLAFLAVLAVSNVYIFSKAAFKEVSLPQFGVYWFGFGIIWISIFAYYKKSYHLFKKLSRKDFYKLINIGIFEVLATYFFFKAIYTIPNPAVVSFIGNISPVFVITLSIIFLKESFNGIEVIGMLIAVIGAFIISYNGKTNLENMFIDGSQYILISSMFFSINAVVIKKNIKNVPPIALAVNRSLYLFIFSNIALFYTHSSLSISSTALKNIFIGSILGPFLTVIAGYLALQYIPLSRKAIVGSTKGLFVLIGAYIYFGHLPRPIAILGGGFTIVGVLLIAFGKMRLKNKK